MNENNIQQIQEEARAKREQEQAMMNVTCQKLAKTLVKLQQVSNEFYEEYDRALYLGVRSKDDKMETEFMDAYDSLQTVIATLMTKVLQVDLYDAVPLRYNK